MTTIRKTPIPDSYWLVEGVLLAGEYPATSDEAGTRVKLTKFLNAGIRTFVGCWYADGTPLFCGTRTITFTE